MEESGTYPTKCLTGKIPKNKFDYEGGVILFHPGRREFVRIAFGTGDNLTQEDLETKDSNGNSVDDYMYLTTYDELQDMGWDGLCLQEKDGGMMLFSHKTYRSGDIREMLTPSLDFLGWPDSVGEYVFISGEGLCEQS